MPILDEFGREIPRAGGGGGGGGSVTSSSNGGGGGGGGLDGGGPPAALSTALQHHRGHGISHNHFDGGPSRSYPPSSSSHHHHHHHHPNRHHHHHHRQSGYPHDGPSPRRGGGGGGEYGSHNPRRYAGERRSASAASSSATIRDKVVESSGGPPPPPGGGASSLQSQQQQHHHPSTRYVKEPMLCAFVWKEEEEKNKTFSLLSTDDNKDGQQDNASKQEEEEGVDNDDKEDDDDHSTTSNVKEKEDEEEDYGKEEGAETGKQEGDDEIMVATKKEQDKGGKDAAYVAYCQKYCWQYLQRFFNAHLDDDWFRRRYSPAHRVRAAERERQRSRAEAVALHREVRGGGASSRNNSGTLLDATWLETTRLREEKGSSSSSSSSAPLPVGHLFSTRARTLEIRDVPPHVTDEQILSSLPPVVVAEASGYSKKGGKAQQPQPASALLEIYASTPQLLADVGGSASSRHGRQPYLHRNTYLVCESVQVYESLWRLLQEQQGSSSLSATLPAPDVAAHVPRKKDETTGSAATAATTTTQQSLTPALLEVDCRDPYGRTEYDADGAGGPPEDGLAVPPRKALLRIRPLTAQPTVVVLSASLSHPQRMAGDKEKAATLARALDVRLGIPMESRLDSLLEVLSTITADEEDLLDVSLAYLRRVHLLNFYKGCIKAGNWADVLAGTEAASQIQVRQQLAESSAPQAGGAATEASATSGGDGSGDDKPAADAAPNDDKMGISGGADDFKNDLLVQRLDEGIRTALETCHEWIAGSNAIVDEETDAAAREIERLETDAKEKWLGRHSLMEEDGRARCSLHFCHKLFKDLNFLQKHLVKKHTPYMVAEQAKCHDGFMMRAWEAATHRPEVPPVLVDCGAQFGCVPSALTGDARPVAPDPEPGLWKQQEEQKQQRMQAEEMRRQRREEMRQRNTHQEQGRMGGDHDSSMSHNHHPRVGKNFVDVDDMAEEVVTVPFEKVAVPSPAAKKKKKKRKLL